MQTKIIGPDVPSTTAERQIAGPVLGLTEEEMGALASTILLCVPHRVSGVTGNLFLNAGFWGRMGLAYGGIEDRFGGFVEVTRAGIVRHFLEYAKDRPSIDKLVMIDADQAVEWDAAVRLASWDLPVVSGIVCNYSDAKGPYACVAFKDRYGVARFPSYKHTKRLPARGLKEAHNVGTGLICIKKNVLETILNDGDYPFRISEKVRDTCFETGTLKEGEDTAFCRQCERHGFRRYVDFSVRAIHYKTLGIQWPQDGLDYELSPDDWTVDDKDFYHG